MIETLNVFKFVTTPAELRQIADQMQACWDMTECDVTLPYIMRDLADVRLLFEYNPDAMRDSVPTPVASVPVAPRQYVCPIFMYLENDGSYSVVSATLPGVASQGDCVDDALANIGEALVGAIESYLAVGDPIPWRKIEEVHLPSGWYTDCIHVTV